MGFLWIRFLVRLEFERQPLRKRLLSISGTPGVSNSGYNIVIIFLALLLAFPIVTTHLTTTAGLALLSAETDFFFMVISVGIFFILTVLMAPLGILIL
jgi:membrane protein YqaA with SNARE-associated domain